MTPIPAVASERERETMLAFFDLGACAKYSSLIAPSDMRLVADMLRADAALLQRAQADALDARRYRYLRDFPPRARARKDAVPTPSLNDMWVSAFLNPAQGTIPEMDILEGAELDARIDAALRTSSPDPIVPRADDGLSTAAHIAGLRAYVVAHPSINPSTADGLVQRIDAIAESLRTPPIVRTEQAAGKAPHDAIALLRELLSKHDLCEWSAADMANAIDLFLSDAPPPPDVQREGVQGFVGHKNPAPHAAPSSAPTPFTTHEAPTPAPAVTDMFEPLFRDLKQIMQDALVLAEAGKTDEANNILREFIDELTCRISRRAIEGWLRHIGRMK